MLNFIRQHVMNACICKAGAPLMTIRLIALAWLCSTHVVLTEGSNVRDVNFDKEDRRTTPGKCHNYIN